MNTKNLMDGMAILIPYYDNPDGWHCGCEHDQFYMYMTSRPVSEDDVKKIHALDWFQEDVEAPEYNPEEAWSAFV